jgi:hypothetical protein
LLFILALNSVQSGGSPAGQKPANRRENQNLRKYSAGPLVFINDESGWFSGIERFFWEFHGQE